LNQVFLINFFKLEVNVFELGDLEFIRGKHVSNLLDERCA